MYDLHGPGRPNRVPTSKFGRSTVAGLCALVLLCGCKEQVPPTPQLRAVATITVQRRVITETVTLRGVANGRDATFDVPAEMMRAEPENPRVEVWLAEDPSVRVTGRVRDVVPQANATARMLTMKVGLENPPPTMQSGANIRSRMRLRSDTAFVLPGTALNETDGRPAVWVVDPQHQTVELRSVEVLRYDASSMAISRGLEDGEIVVTAGVHALVPRQKVRLLRSAS
jgi:multidrug efflux pump subunit AcrA (membrane-fusion protein)